MIQQYPENLTDLISLNLKMRHNAMHWVSTKLGYVYCTSCVVDNPQQDYEQATMREGDRCAVCHRDPEIIPTGAPVILEHTTARVF